MALGIAGLTEQGLSLYMLNQPVSEDSQLYINEGILPESGMCQKQGRQ